MSLVTATKDKRWVTGQRLTLQQSAQTGGRKGTFTWVVREGLSQDRTIKQRPTEAATIPEIF